VGRLFKEILFRQRPDTKALIPKTAYVDD